MPNHLRNTDDELSDPELLASRYRIGRSVFFEVELATADIFDRVSVNFSSLQATAVGLEASSIFASGVGGIGCPEENQVVLVKSIDNTLSSIKVKNLIGKNKTFFLYNPLTGNYNKLVEARKFSTELFEFSCLNGSKLVCSLSHKIIRNTGDFNGRFILDHPIGEEVLTSIVKLEGKKPRSLDLELSTFTEFTNLGKTGNVVEISLESEFIYSVGSSIKFPMVLSHNRKDPGDGTV